MKNDFCDLSQQDINNLEIPNDLKGFLLSPFQFGKGNGVVPVPVDAFKEMIDYLTQYALLMHCVEPKWQKMDPSWVVEFIRGHTKFDADLIETMLQSAANDPKKFKESTASSNWIDELVAEHGLSVRPTLVAEIKEMGREELQRRLLIASDWARAWSDSLNGIPEIRCIPGGGSDGTRLPNNVQAIVKKLVKVSPVTFENSCEGNPMVDQPTAAATLVSQSETDLLMVIAVRRDLNMRKGKMAAQVAHAAGAQLLNSMDDFGEYRVLSAANHLKLKRLIQAEAVEIRMVADEAALRQSLNDPELSTVITDRGLTEFGGVPTVTTAAQGVFEPSARKAVPLAGADLIARQWYVFSKQQPLPKEVAAKMAAIGCLVMLESLLQPLEGSSDGDMKLCLSNEALHGWLTAGFGKIGMGIKTDVDMEHLQAALESSNVHYVGLSSGASNLVVIGPEFPERMSTLIGKESQLYTEGLLTLL